MDPIRAIQRAPKGSSCVLILVKGYCFVFGVSDSFELV